MRKFLEEERERRSFKKLGERGHTERLREIFQEGLDGPKVVESDELDTFMNLEEFTVVARSQCHQLPSPL